MILKNLLLTTGALVAGLVVSTSGAKAQGPLYDRVNVDLPYAVTINNTVLQPGHYVIRQLDDAGTNSRVLMIFGDNGMKLKATALTINALDINTPEKTSVVLHHYGNDYYFDKVWIQGKNYGYEFPLPPAVKARSREALQPYTVAANYDQTSDKAADTTTSASAAPAPSTDNSAAASTDNTQVAQNTPAPTMDNSSNNNSNNSAPAPASEPAMPHTAGNWLGLMLSGGMLSGAGAMLRKLRK
jgi:hypothetical protein